MAACTWGMEQVHEKQSKWTQTAYKLHPLAILLLYLCISSANLHQVRENHKWGFDFFIFLLLMNLTRKLQCVCIYYTYQATALLLGIFLFRTGVAYELQLASYGLELNCLQNGSSARCSTSGVVVYIFWVWHIVKTLLWITKRMQLWVSRSSTGVSFIDPLRLHDFPATINSNRCYADMLLYQSFNNNTWQRLRKQCRSSSTLATWLPCTMNLPGRDTQTLTKSHPFKGHWSILGDPVGRRPWHVACSHVYACLHAFHSLS